MEWTEEERHQMINDLRTLGKKGAGSRRRDAQYARVQRVCEYYIDLKKDGVTKKVTRLIAQEAGIEGWESMHPVNRLIAVGSLDDEKMQSRQASAVKYCALKEWARMAAKLRKYGGISGLAAKWAKHRRAKKQRKSPPSAVARKVKPDRREEDWGP